jgi:hypothetical protein
MFFFLRMAGCRIRAMATQYDPAKEHHLLSLADARRIKLSTARLFVLVIIVWFVINLWGGVLNAGIQDIFFNGEEPSTFNMAIVATVFTVGLFVVAKLANVNFITLVGG